MFRILIVASIRLYREGLADALCRRQGLMVVGTASSRTEAVERSQELAPHVVLLDMATAESVTIAREIETLAPSTRTIGLGVAEAEEDVLACAESGLAGYVPREGSLDDLVATVESAARGEVICSPRVAGSLWRRITELAATQEPGARPAELTRREREIVRLIDQDLSNKEIACQLGVEVATVKNHVHNLLDKLGVHRRTEAARLFARLPVTQADQVNRGARPLLDQPSRRRLGF